MIVVNSSTRQFNIPGADMTFGVEADSGSERKVFSCPRYVGNGLDVAGSFVRINYRNANGDIDSYLVDDVTVDGDNITFSWELTPKVTAYKGQIRFVMCVTGPDTKVAWHTTLGTGVVLEGLEPDYIAIQADTADVVAQLIALVDRQTAAVKAEGTNQVTVVKNAAKAAETASVAQVESKGASTLATIPEDYTAVQNAVRGMANAIRGKVSGEVIRVDDVSPVEHYPEIRVHGKNLLPPTVMDFANWRLEPGSKVTYLYDLPHLKDGVSYTISANILDNSIGYFYVEKSRDGFITNTDIHLHSPNTNRLPVTFVKEKGYEYRFFWFEVGRTLAELLTNLQMEEGTSVTEYTPYVDPTTVTVTGCGRNILPYPFLTTGGTFGGVTVTSMDNALFLNGTATKNTAIPLFIGNIRVKGRYTISGVTGGSGATYYVQPYIDETTAGGTTDGPRTYEWDGVLTRINLNIVSGFTFNNLRVPVMVEHGDVSYGDGSYTGETQIPDADGKVSGLSAVSPTMTLMTNTPGVTIDCEYSRDTNKVIAEILNKITALGG